MEVYGRACKAFSFKTDIEYMNMYLMEIIWVCSLWKQAKTSFQVGCTNTWVKLPTEVIFQQ
jgi:hypothetical protein